MILVKPFWVPVSVLLLVVIALAGPEGRAQVLLNETFESYGAEISLHGLNPGDGNPANWIVGNASPGTKGANVVPGSSTGGTGANQRVGRYFYTTQATSSLPTMRRLFAPTGVMIRTTFKIRIEDPAAGTHQVILAGTTEGGTAGRFRFSPTSFGVLGANSGPGVGTGSIETIISNVRLGDWYEVTMTLDPVSQTFWASVENLDNTSPGQSGVSGIHYFWSNISVINRWSVEQATSHPAGALFDDILVEVVPEEIPPLRVDLLPPTSEGYFRMNVFDPTKGTIGIDASTDLVDWKIVVFEEETDAAGIYEFVDTETHAFDRRFYRALRREVGEFPELPGGALTRMPSRSLTVDGRLEGETALVIQEGTLEWEIYDAPGPDYFIEFWMRPVDWNPLDGSAVHLAEFSIGSDVYLLEKLADETTVVMRKEGGIIRSYPVYAWDESEWVHSMSRVRPFQRSVGWHHVVITIAGAEMLVTIDGFTSRVTALADVHGSLNRFALHGNPGTAIQDLVIASGGTLNPTTLRSRFLNRLMGLADN